MSRRRHTADPPHVNQSAKFGIPKIDDLAVRCAAGAIAALGPETILGLLVMTDEQLGQLLKKAVSSLSLRLGTAHTTEPSPKPCAPVTKPETVKELPSAAVPDVHFVPPYWGRKYLTTDEAAAILCLQPQTLRKSYSQHGHYMSIKPRRAPNRRLYWNIDEIKAVLEGPKITRPSRRTARHYDDDSE